MSDAQEDQHTRDKVLLAFLNNNNTIVSTIPSFVRYKTLLGEKIEEVSAVDSGRPGITAGKTTAKQNAKLELAASVYEVASALYSYGDDKNLPELTERYDHTVYYYEHLRDTALINEAIDITAKALPLKTELADEGLTEAEINEVTTKMNAFNSALSTSGTSDGVSVAATKTVAQIMSEIRGIISNHLDGYAEKAGKTNPEFYTAYLSVRQIISTARTRETTEPVPDDPVPTPQ